MTHTYQNLKNSEYYWKWYIKLFYQLKRSYFKNLSSHEPSLSLLHNTPHPPSFHPFLSCSLLLSSLPSFFLFAHLSLAMFFFLGYSLIFFLNQIVGVLSLYFSESIHTHTHTRVYKHTRLLLTLKKYNCLHENPNHFFLGLHLDFLSHYF